MLTGGKITYFLNGSKNPQTNLLTMTQSGSNVLLSGLAPGAVSAASLDGINGSQLYGMAASVAKDLGAGAGVAANGAVTAPSYVISGSTYNDVGSALDALGNGSATDAVQYDTSAHDSVTLGGVGSTVPVALHNVANGELSASSLDAVNGQQLFQTNQNVSNLTGAVTSIAGDITNINSTLADAVQYDSSAHDSVTLGGASHAPVKLTNVMAGAVNAASSDAVNGSQLYGLASSTASVLGGSTSVNPNGSISTPSFVVSGTTYNNVGDALGALSEGGGTTDPLAVHYDDTSMARVTLGGVGSSTPVTLSNVAAGVAPTDAVNVAQMNQAVITGNPYIGGHGSGAAAQSTATGAVALGLGSVANVANTISVGDSSAGLTRRITNVAAGVNLTDAANVSQLNQSTTTMLAAVDTLQNNTQAALRAVNNQLGAVSAASTAVSKVGATDSPNPWIQIAGPADGSQPAYATPLTASVAIGQNSTATVGAGVAIGADALSTGTGAMAIGNDALAVNNGSFAMGTSSTAFGSQATALGYGAAAFGDNSTAVGMIAHASGTNSVAIGDYTSAAAWNSIAVGQWASVNAAAANSIALGNRAQVSSAASNSVALGALSVADRANSISVGSSSQQRQITYVAAGTAGTDAVNVSQLTSAVSAFGADATVGADGSIVNPSYVVAGNTYNNVGDAINALEAAGSSDPLAVHYDDSSNSSVTLGGVGSTTPVKLTNVAAGDISSASSTDAVNGGQLYATNQNVSNLAGAVTSIAGDITNINGTLADAVLYDSSAHDTVTLGGTGASAAVKLTNVANGALAASSTDAVNGSQLYALGATTDGSGNITNAFVTYDDTSKGSVTLGGVGSTTPVKLTNVAAGDISSASSTDAVNGGQLYTTNQNVSNLAGAVTNIAGDITNINGTLADAVLYDSSAHDTVTLGGTGASAAVKLTNVANGALAASSTDAVNGSQLYALGATTDGSGNITNAFVTYDDTSKGSVTLGGVGSSAPVALHNVAAGAAPTDAVNVAQMNQAVITGNPYIGGQGSGVAAQATAVGAVALGLGSVANTAYTISVGDSSTNLTRRITNVATGVAGTDAVNVNQLDSAMGGVSATALEAVNNLQSSTQTALRAVNNQLGALSAVSATGVSDSSDPWVQVAGPADGSQPAYATPLTGSLAIGQKATATVGAGVAIGADALSTGTGAVAIGSDATASNNGSFAMGTSATASGNQANALGYGAVALGDNSTAIGQANALALNAFAVGYNSSAAAANSMAIGLNTAVSSQATNSIALGSKAKVTSAAPNSVALGASSVADRANTVSVGSGSQQRQIIYVAAGTASTDAVNVSQLTSAVSAFGANASVGADGSITGPSYVIGSQTYNNVGDALNALEVGGNGDPLAVHYDDTSMSTVTLGGAGTTTPVVLTNVANGGVSASSVDAVNGAQLYALGATTDASGNITNTFVAYDNTSMNSVTLGGSMDHAPVQLHNVAAGVVSSSSFDAVNGTQLYGLASSTAAALGGSTIVNPNGSISAPSYDLSGTTYNDVGSALSAVMEVAKGGGADAVVYDTSMHDKITLGGINATNGPVQLTNVANGALNASSTDAVNGAQLYALGAATDSSGNVTNAFVAYDDTSKTRITLGAQGTTTPTALTNVANGQLNASSTDAVNGQQLFATNQSISDLSGTVTNIAGDVTNLYGKVADAVLYDSSAHDSVTFGNAGSPVALHNVANGVVSQASYDAVNGSQLYGLASSAASALGGQTTVNPNGTITAPTYVVQGSSYNDVGSALDAIAAVAGGGSVDAVMYDTSAHDKITLGGQNSTVGPVLLTNLSNGALSASSSDAVNGAQLYALGATTDSSGNITNAFVAYDDTSKSSVTFGGAGATSGVVLHNVAAGAQDLDAVNVAQLKAAGLNVDTSGNVLNAFVAYDDTSKSSITLGGIGSTTPVALHNVANGVTANDAVNVAQLEAMGANVDSSGNVTNSFVAYDDSTKSSVTFGGLGATTPVTLHNVGAGLVAASSTDAVNGAQLYNVASSTASSLGGGSTVQADGSISAPSYSIGGNTYNNVGGALTNLDGRVTNIENTVTNIAGSVANAVQYDSSAHDKITLGGTDASTAVALTNVANGALNASSTDAVNGSQLYATNVQVSNLNQAIQNINITGSEYMSTNTSSGAASATGANSIAAGGGAIASGANSTAMGDKASATGNNSVALGANSVANEDNTVSVGSQGNERRITNVANGINPTDAANVGQLQSGLNALQGNVNSVARNAYGGVAAATALTMIPDVDQNKTIAVGVGTANFQGYQAVALGASARITQNLKVKLGGGYASGGGATYGGGMSYQW